MAVKFPNEGIETSSVDWLIGTGEMANRIRLYDWSQTTLGPRNQWPAALRFSVNAMLSTHHPTVIAWGEQLKLLYNDAYLKIISEKHPSALGKPMREVWSQIWPIIKPDFDRVMLRHEPVFIRDQKFTLQFQNNLTRDIYLSVYIYPICTENGQVGGVHSTLIDTSESNKQAEFLGEYEQQLRLIMEELSDYAIFQLTADGNIVSCSAGAEKILGYQADEIIGQHYSLFYSLEANRADDIPQELTKSKGRVEVEGWRVRKDSSKLFAKVITTPFWSDTGALLGFVKVIRDITQRKRAEDVLRESEHIYRAIGESIDYGIWICDPEGRNIYASESFLKLVGLTQEQCSTFGWANVLHPDDAERTLSAWKKCVLAGEKWDIEHRFRDVDGQWHPILARGIPVRNERGKIIAWAGINLDISYIKRVDIKLKVSEEKFRSLFNAIPHLAWMAHPDGSIFLYNKQWYEYTGTTEEQMEGWGWQSVHDPEILPMVLERWKAAITDEQPFEMEFPLRRADGKFHWFLTRILPVRNLEGQVVRWFGTNTDITERKHTDEQLQLTSERLALATHAAQVGIWDWDLSTNELVWNDQMYQLYGITPEKFSGAYEAWENSIHPDDLGRATEELQKTLQGEADFNSEFRVVWPDGSIHHIQAIGRIKKNKSGHPARLTGTNWDITLRKKLEDSLQAAIDLRDEFLYIASHEFKTPLTALSIQVEILNKLASEGVNDNIALFSKKALTSVRSLAKLTNDLLDVTKIRVGKMDLHKHEMNLKTALLQVISNVEGEAALQGVSIILKADQPAHGKWDPTRIDQVLSNLLSNAIKYGEGKPIDVTLVVDSSSNLARILIKDYGIGIPKKMHSAIFGRFQRAISGKSISGLGLGLYIARQIIEAHGGSIRVESMPKRGALFIVELPLNQP